MENIGAWRIASWKLDRTAKGRLPKCMWCGEKSSDDRMALIGFKDRHTKVHEDCLADLIGEAIKHLLSQSRKEA
jgi:hypothetical protein